MPKLPGGLFDVPKYSERCVNAKTAKFTQIHQNCYQNGPNGVTQIQILPTRSFCNKGLEMCLQESLKIWPKLPQKVLLILPNLSKIAQVGQKRPNWPKMPKMPKFWHVPPHPLHTMIQQSRDRSVQHLHTQILWIATSCFIKVSSLCRSLRF